jgi:hypothetical protein
VEYTPSGGTEERELRDLLGFLLYLGGALTAAGEAVNRIEQRLRRVAAAYGAGPAAGERAADVAAPLGAAPGLERRAIRLVHGAGARMCQVWNAGGPGSPAAGGSGCG